MLSHPSNTNPFPGPFLNFRATVRVLEVTLGNRSFVEIEANFDTVAEVSSSLCHPRLSAYHALRMFLRQSCLAMPCYDIIPGLPDILLTLCHAPCSTMLPWRPTSAACWRLACCACSTSARSCRLGLRHQSLLRPTLQPGHSLAAQVRVHQLTQWLASPSRALQLAWSKLTLHQSSAQSASTQAAACLAQACLPQQSSSDSSRIATSKRSRHATPMPSRAPPGRAILVVRQPPHHAPQLRRLPNGRGSRAWPAQAPWAGRPLTPTSLLMHLTGRGGRVLEMRPLQGGTQAAHHG